MNREKINTLPQLHVGASQRYGNLTWFPVWTDAPVSTRGYATNPTKHIKVEELPDAQVSRLQVENSSPKPVVLFEGMILEGGWQHRSLTKTVVVPAQVRMQLPVVCVEQGRWDASTNRQRFGSRIAPAKVRTAMRGATVRQDGTIAQSAPDQGMVWSKVSEYQHRYRNLSRTSSMKDVFDGLDSELKQLPKVTALAGQRGVIIAAKGQPIALELFDHPRTLAERLESILQGYQLDAADLPFEETPGRRARRFAERITQIEISRTEQDDVSERMRSIDNPYVATEALFYQGGLLHVSAINARHELTLAA